MFACRFREGLWGREHRVNHFIGTNFERREPRCRICRDEDVRVLVNRLLDWRGLPTTPGQRRSHKVTYADILRDLEHLNEGCDERDRITYDSLWVHAKRHYELDGLEAYWSAQMHRKLKNALMRQRGKAYRRATESGR
jgi:hypothetical protein